MLDLSIEYCAVWHYTERAVSLMAELIKQHEYDIQRFTLIPSDGGSFEVKIGQAMIYSKLGTGRHAEPGEVEKLVAQHLKKEG